MRLKRITRILLISILFWSQIAFADDGTSAADFLNIGVSARTAGTGEALSVLSDGPIASYYNPAGLANVNNIQVAGMHSEWYQDLRYEFLGASFPVHEKGGVGLSMSYLSLGSFNAFSDNNTAIGSVDAYDWSFGLSYGHKLTPGLSLGAGAKMVGEKLDNVSAHGFAGDIGLQYRGYKYGVGMALLNIGPSIKYENASSSMPTRYDIGFSYLPLGSRLALLAGLSVPFHGEIGFRTGLEYTYAGILTFRSGYDSADRIDSRSGVSLGAGFNVLKHSLDYAYNVNNALGGTHQLSFVLRFGQPANQDRVETPPPPPAAKEEAKPEIKVASEVKPEIKVASKEKAIYLVCAGRYSTQASAEKHVQTLEKFGFSPRISENSQSDYLVVMDESNEGAKAEKLRAGYEKAGISCFIEEE